MRRALLAIVLVFPVVMLPQVFLRGAESARTLEPTWMHLVVLTARAWPAGGGAGEAFEGLQRDGVRLGPLFAPSDSSAASAASLWTGRWPRSHGVVDADRALPEGAWSLAGAARSSGAATAAFLEEPFASVTGINGFAAVREEPRLDVAALAQDVARFYAEHRDERTVVWVHLADTGARGERLEDAIEALRSAVGDGQRQLDTLVLVTGLAGYPAPFLDATAIVPVYLVLPTRMNAGTATTPHLSLVDVTGLLARLMRLDADAGGVQSRVNPMQFALGGGRPTQPVELRIGGEWIYRMGLVRVRGEHPGTPEQLVQGMISTEARALAGAEAAAALLEAQEMRDALDAAAEPARAARRSPKWSDWR